jgi:UDP-N-acetylglucosamine acyltransferase
MSARIELMDNTAAGAAAQIDPRAAISSSAIVGPGCRIGAFAVIGDGVRLGEGCVVHPHAVISGPTVLGQRNEVYSFACIGGSPQDLRHDGEPTELVVGEGNAFREHVTVSRGTVHGGGRTVIGSHNLFMAYTHVAHDCQVGSRVVMANHATLAGHAVVGDHVVFGGMVGVGTFLRIGESAMLAAGAMVEREVPPFCIVAGDRARLRAINRVGLDRRGIGPAAKQQIKAIFRMLKDADTPLSEVIAHWRSAPSSDDALSLTPEAERMIRFLETATRGLAR